ncbi:complement factor H-like [Moschus berezovskii]|uniref:complement factor H-like n=1 Tax=Moschus berezovskii TaxID=68408 RepID=UPI0024443B17|nr:complement factor H-like [Moschus berezovskii]
MFLLINIVLALWFPCAHGQVKPCDFPVIKHGRLYYAFKGYFPASVGQRFSYRCNRYFVTPSQSSWDYMTCTLKGWSPEVPCLRQCTFNYLENGYYTNSQEKYLQGKTVRVRCHDGYSLHNNQNTMTCTEKGWYPPPVCVRVDTLLVGPALPRAPQRIHVPLPQGRLPVQALTVASKPLIRLPCGPPPSIQNGVVHHKNDSYQYGEKVTYTCTKGFRIYGFAAIRCLGGKWSRTPKCISTDCFNLPSFDDAVLTGKKKKSYRSGEQVAFKCRPYYQLEGSNTIQCVKSRWIGRPVCRDVSCVNPPRVENAVVQSERPRYQNGERARYECIGTYDILGDADVTCFNGTWTKPPRCKDPQGRCGPPPPIDNGDTTSFPLPQYPPGSAVEYQCQAYYVLQGNRYIVCRNGEWSEPPKCLGACVISEEMMKQHNIQLKWRDDRKLYTRTDDTIEFTCKHGYRPKTPNHTFRTTCQEGKVVYPHFLFGQNKDYSPGDSISESSEKLPRTGSKEEKCPKPDLKNGYIFDSKLSYKIQENIRYRCVSGYKTIAGQDEEVVQCLAYGWSSQPTCRKEHETCLAPELHHGNYSTTQKTFKVKDKVQYECASGYHTASGKKTEEVECHPYGWALTPQCTRRRNRCPPPPLPLNSNLQTFAASYRHGETVRVECALDFALQGAEEIRCENGKWTEPPRCVEDKQRTTCEAPPAVGNGAAQPSSGLYHSGDKVTYVCDRGFHLRGPGEVTCTRGRWTLPPECVDVCVIPEDNMNKNNMRLKWKLEKNKLCAKTGDIIDPVYSTR